MNKKNSKESKRVANLRRQVVGLQRKLANNAPIGIASKTTNQGKDFYTTKGCERISQVSVLNSSYTVIGLFINAANPGLFPWLSGIAKKYDLYRFKKLIFRYKPAVPTDEGGNMYLGVDYNTLDPSPPDSKGFCQLSHWTTNVVWKPNSLILDLKNSSWYYTRSGAINNADYKTYDIGKFFFATEGITYANAVGYIEVEYDVEFARRQPDYLANTVPEVPDFFYFVDDASYVTTSVGANATNTILSLPTNVVTDTSEFGVAQTSTKVTLPRGDYLIIVNGYCGSSSVRLFINDTNGPYTYFTGNASNYSFLVHLDQETDISLICANTSGSSATVSLRAFSIRKLGNSA